MKALTLPALSLMMIAAQALWGAKPDDAAPWLRQGVGARPLGMGKAFLALADDASAGYWNPAGLTRLGLRGTQVAAMTSLEGQDQQWNYLGLAQHIEGWADLYAGVNQHAITGIEGYDEQGRRQEDFSHHAQAYTLGLAGKPEYRFRWGLGLKALHEELGVATAWGWAADMGFMVMPDLAGDFTVALALKDLGGELLWATGWRDRLSPRLGLGIADRYLGRRLALSAEAEAPLKGESDAHFRLGGEYWLNDMAALRLGTDNDEPSAGASFVWGFYEFDYAACYRSQALNAWAHHASMLLKF